MMPGVLLHPVLACTDLWTMTSHILVLSCFSFISSADLFRFAPCVSRQPFGKGLAWLWCAACAWKDWPNDFASHVPFILLIVISTLQSHHDLTVAAADHCYALRRAPALGRFSALCALPPQTERPLASLVLLARTWDLVCHPCATIMLQVCLLTCLVPRLADFARERSSFPVPGRSFYFEFLSRFQSKVRMGEWTVLIQTSEAKISQASTRLSTLLLSTTRSGGERWTRPGRELGEGLGWMCFVIRLRIAQRDHRVQDSPGLRISGGETEVLKTQNVISSPTLTRLIGILATHDGSLVRSTRRPDALVHVKC